MIGLLLGWILTGLIVGAVARVVLPGPTPMSIGRTIGLGIAGSFVGGIVAYGLGLAGLGTFIVAVLVTAGLIYLMQGRTHRLV